MGRGAKISSKAAFNRLSSLNNSSHGEAVDNDAIFFARQIKENSCATHALVSIIFNCPAIECGPLLESIRTESLGQSSEGKGQAIAKNVQLGNAHNKFASVDRNLKDNTSVTSLGSLETGTRTADAFHFVSFVPIGGRLYELDGLQERPIDHGPASPTSWRQRFSEIIGSRIHSMNGETRFNLMALVPDRRIALKESLHNLTTNRQTLLNVTTEMLRKLSPEAKVDTESELISHLKLLSPTSGAGFAKGFQSDNQIPWFQTYPEVLLSPSFVQEENAIQESVVTPPEPKPEREHVTTRSGTRRMNEAEKKKELYVDTSSPSHYFLTPQKFIALLSQIDGDIVKYQTQIKEEEAKHRKFEIDHQRRTFDFEPFIRGFLYNLAQNGKLSQLLDDSSDSKKITSKQPKAKLRKT